MIFGRRSESSSIYGTRGVCGSRGYRKAGLVLGLLFLAIFPWSAAKAVTCGSTNNFFYDDIWGPGGGSGSISITYPGPSGCTYSISSDSTWIVLQSPTSGTWTGSPITVNYTVLSNSDSAPRNGTISDTNSVSAPVVQNSSNCTFSFSSVGSTFPASGGAGAMVVNSSPAGCWWFDDDEPFWVNIEDEEGSGPDFVQTPVNVFYTVDPNSGLARFGSITSFSDPSSSAEFPIAQAGAFTVTSLTVGPNPSLAGQNVILTATVQPSSAGGTVTFYDNNGTTPLATVGVSGGTAIYSTSGFSVGAHPLTAVYNGDQLDPPSTSGTVTLTVNKDPTTTTCSASPNPAIWGQTVTITATATAQYTTPSSTVTFFDNSGSTTLGTVGLSGGSASYSTNSLSVGSHSLSVTYGGDANDLSSNGSCSVTVNRAASSLSISSLPNPSVVGDTVTITASATPASATGTVTFQDNGNGIGSATLSNGSASISTSSLSPGTHTLSASYGGDIHFTGSSANTNQQVNNVNSSVTVTSSLNPSTYGQPVTLSATVAPPDATGTVAFSEGAASYGTSPLSNGSASLTLNSLPPGTHNLTATYSGDTKYGSTSAALSEVVQKIPTSVGLTGAPVPGIQGQQVTFTAVVTPAATQSPAPGGSVIFQDVFQGVPATLATVSLNGTSATFSTSSLAPGSHSVSANYSGDGFYQSSLSPAFSEAITSTVNISAIIPSTAPAGGAGFNLTINGAGFTSGASAQWNGTNLQTTFVSPTQLTAAVPSNLIATTGTASVTVISSGNLVTGVPFTVTPPTVPCSFSFTYSNATFGAAGGQGNIGVTASRNDCPWTATSNVTWITFPGGASGTGSGPFGYNVAVNSGATTREGKIMIGQQAFQVTQGGPCLYTLPYSSAAFSSDGGSGTVAVQAPPGCPWNATSNSPVVTFPNGSSGTGDGQLTYNLAPNTSTSSTNIVLSVANLPFDVTEGGTTPSLTCSANVPNAPSVALEGRTEVLGDLLLNCTNISNSTNIDVTLTLNTNVTNALTNGASDAILTINGASAQKGLVTGYNVIHWLGVSLPSLTGSAGIRITGVRADASLLATAGLPPAAITGQVHIASVGDVPVTGVTQTMARAATSLNFTQLQGTPPSNGQSTIPLKFQEGLAPSFTSNVTRLRAALSNIPGNVQVYAPIFPSEGASRAQLYNADSNGFGGTAQAGSPFAGGTYQKLTVAADGSATATWLVLTADPTVLETWTFPVLVVGASINDLNAIVINGTLAPISNVTIASASAPVPRFRDLASALAAVNLRMTSSIKTPGASAPTGAAQAPLVPVSAGNQTTINFAVENDTSNQPATNVIVQGNLPTGLTLISCTFLGAACSTSGNQLLATVPQLTPGTTDTGSVTVQVGSTIPDGTILDVTVSSVSDQASEDLGASTTSTSVIVTTKPTLTLTTNPPGLKVAADNANPLPGPQTYNNWAPGSSHTISVPTPQNNSLDGATQAVFQGWSDGDKTNPRTVAAPASNITYTANFTTQYRLLANPSPIAGGAVSTSPAGGPFFNAGSQVVLTATPAAGYSFAGWTGDVTSATNPLTVTLNSPLNLTARFTPGTSSAPATHFSVAAASSAAPGTPVQVTVTALDSNNNTATTYSGTVHFTSSDPAAVLPSDNQLTNGSRTFSITLTTAGPQTVTATDTANSSVTGTSNAIVVTKAGRTVLPPSPASGAGNSQTFLFMFSDPAGAQDLSVINILIINALDARKACYLGYSVQPKSLVLVDDAGDAGGPFAPGTQNSQCAAVLSSATTNGQTLTLALNITFTAALGGNNVVYLAARDQAQNNTGWKAMGVWQVPFNPPGNITVGTVNPASASIASGKAQSFTFTISDKNAASDLGIVDVLINSALDGRQGCYVAYVPNTNGLLLVNDAGQAQGPFLGMVLNGGGPAIQNSQCMISPSSSAVTSGNTVTLTLNITFTSAFTGNRIVYVGARDVAEGNNTGWQAMAVLAIQ